MSFPSYNPGDKVEIIAESEAEDGLYRWVIGLKPGVQVIVRKVGDILEVTQYSTCGDNSHIRWKADDAMSGEKSIKKSCIRLCKIVDSPCHCPLTNFAWNGPGCQCGGT